MREKIAFEPFLDGFDQYLDFFPQQGWVLGKEGDLDLQGGKGGEGLTPQPMYGKTILSLAKWTHRLPWAL